MLPILSLVKFFKRPFSLLLSILFVHSLACSNFAPIHSTTISHRPLIQLNNYSPSVISQTTLFFNPVHSPYSNSPSKIFREKIVGKSHATKDLSTNVC
ncbi:unnamed protein product [Meloidogyne enterolobii]|uniref:Uncharacterized protein n=1 Tax=Meloidogyne enterolobii TaxID=390850 RepID=A0ACB0YKE4_MELEN